MRESQRDFATAIQCINARWPSKTRVIIATQARVRLARLHQGLGQYAKQGALLKRALTSARQLLVRKQRGELPVQFGSGLSAQAA